MNLGLFVFSLDIFAGCLCSHRHLCDAFVREQTGLWSFQKHTHNLISLLTSDQKLVLVCVDEINCLEEESTPSVFCLKYKHLAEEMRWRLPLKQDG